MKSIFLCIGFYGKSLGVFHRTTAPRSLGSLRFAHHLTEDYLLMMVIFLELMIFFLCEANLSMFASLRSRRRISSITSNGMQWRSRPRKAICVQIDAVKRTFPICPVAYFSSTRCSKVHVQQNTICRLCPTLARRNLDCFPTTCVSLFSSAPLLCLRCTSLSCSRLPPNESHFILTTAFSTRFLITTESTMVLSRSRFRWKLRGVSHCYK